MSDSGFIREVNARCTIQCACGFKFTYAQSTPHWSQKFLTCPDCKASGWVDAKFVANPALTENITGKCPHLLD